MLAEAERDPHWAKGSAISFETGFHLRTPAGQTAAWNQLKQEEPDLP